MATAREYIEELLECKELHADSQEFSRDKELHADSQEFNRGSSRCILHRSTAAWERAGR